MTAKQPYSYTVLRYVHDVTTGEFVNVGLVLHMQAAGILRARVRSTIGRIKDIFPDLDRRTFVSAVKAVENAVGVVAREVSETRLLHAGSDAGALARRALPVDYSSLQWSPVGTGLSDDAGKTFERLYERLVTRYDVKSAHRRTDADVWRPVRDLLAERNIEVKLEPKEIIGKADDISFKHAWKNGVWHAYEPLSLDLADAEGIKDKARRWLGHLVAVEGASADPVRVHFILGKPQTQVLIPAYEKAKAILLQAPGRPEIFEEDQIEGLVSGIEDEYRRHAGAAGHRIVGVQAQKQ